MITSTGAERVFDKIKQHFHDENKNKLPWPVRLIWLEHRPIYQKRLRRNIKGQPHTHGMDATIRNRIWADRILHRVGRKEHNNNDWTGFIPGLQTWSNFRKWSNKTFHMNRLQERILILVFRRKSKYKYPFMMFFLQFHVKVGITEV